ncbi:MAG: T9SS type A sorting domain-containing protein [candidate division WOR-3 bacterium]
MLKQKFFTVSIFLFLFVKIIYGECFNTLLLTTKNHKISDINFILLCNYYGLTVKEINLETTPSLDDSMFKNENGEYIKTICISCKNLEDPYLINTEEILLIKSIIFKGTNILINDISDSFNFINLKTLTDFKFSKTEYFRNGKAWLFNEDSCKISDVFSKKFIPCEYFFEDGFTVTGDGKTDLITDSENTNSIFSYFNCGKGKIFLNGCITNASLLTNKLVNLYYGSENKPKSINNILPIMMFLKFSNGTMCWHSDKKYANLTIDDPNLIEQFGSLNYKELLRQMEIHKFHTTIAFIPKNFESNFDTSVLNLFKDHPDKFSITIHGNNHDGYEFICFTQEQLDSLNKLYNNRWITQIPRPFKDQECDIVESITRMELFKLRTGIDYSMDMVFPWGISLSPTLGILKKYNFNSTVNFQTQPFLFLEDDYDTNYDYKMRPVNLNFSNFAVIGRHPPYFLDDSIGLKFFLDLFIDKPLLLYCHENFFSKGIDSFNPFADFVNFSFSDIEWKSLGYITKRTYLQKENFDGSIDVQFYGNSLILSNSSNTQKTYNLKRYEKLNSLFLTVLVDGVNFPFKIENETLYITLVIPPNREKEIHIKYRNPIDFSFTEKIDFKVTEDSLSLCCQIVNLTSDSGACPIFLYESNKNNLQYISTIFLSPFDTQTIYLSLDKNFDFESDSFSVMIDPYNLIHEFKKENNELKFCKKMKKLSLNSLPKNNIYLVDQNENELTFVFDSPTILNEISINLYNIEGRSVLNKANFFKTENKKLVVNVSELPTGIFFIKFQSGSFYNKTIKFIKF